MTGVRIAVVGGGIAGVSAAYHLVEAHPDTEVFLLEAEPVLAHHTTGRSAAILLENLTTRPNLILTRASVDFLRDTPTDLVDAPLLSPRTVMHISSEAQSDQMDELLAEGSLLPSPSVELTVDEAMGYFPPLRRELVHRAVLEPDCADIDVGALHQAYVRGFRRGGGRITTSARVDAARPDGNGWRLETTDGDVGADIVVNAAGAWGDVVAARAGVEPIGLQPCRRTAFMVNGPGGDATGWSFTADVAQNWYVKNDGEQMLCSLGDETPSKPCDAKPAELDIALAIERINEATTLGIRSVNSAWAGLRTFTPDRSLAIGPDSDQPTFVWCVGQGGCGIYTSRGAGVLLADLALGGEPSATFGGADVSGLLPGRFRSSG
ncbi:uncharacterized protein METZ01_LOCUS76119 [marine metagenome]|uniref:FAD dependent oxidoreductase domain-containing protein n=1 Tax=marine metagenome TaxID=408172 RepID=A0A381U4U7_9ZZZZ